MGNSEPIPTIFLKPAQRGGFGYIERFRNKFIDQFMRYDFSKMNSYEDFGPPGAQWYCLSVAPRCRGSLAESIAFNVSFLGATSENSKSGVSTLTLQLCTGCPGSYMTVDWVAYRSAWAKGTREGRGEAPRRLPCPRRQSDRQPNRLSCMSPDTQYR